MAYSDIAKIGAALWLNLMFLSEGHADQNRDVRFSVDGLGFPDASNTGPAAGVELKPSGPLVITTPGITIQNLDIAGDVVIKASDVKLLNSRIRSGSYYAVRIEKGLTGVVVQNCEIDNLSAGGTGITGQGRIIANNIHGAVDGINVWGDDTLIQGNYIHDMAGPPSAHFDSIQADGGFKNLTIVHNTVVNEHGQTSTIMSDNYWGPIDNVKIDNNLLLGGGYTVYLNEVAKGQAPGGPVTNVSFTNNTLGKGYYGYWDIRVELGNKPVVSGNVDKVSGAKLQAPRGLVREQ